MNLDDLINTHPVLIMFGSGALFFVIRKLTESIQSKSWPSMMGTIESSEIKRNPGSVDEGPLDFVDIRYSYVVKNKQYSSTKRLMGVLGIYPSANAIQKKYPMGKIIQVYVKPQFPKTSRLKTGVTFWEVASLILIPWLALSISRNAIVMLLVIGIAVALNLITWLFYWMWRIQGR